MDELTEEQERFLLRYINNKGDFYKTADSLGIDLFHITSWQQSNKKFIKLYKEAKRTVIEHLKQENYMMGLMRVNDALLNGVQQNVITHKHKIGSYDEETGEQQSEFEVVRTTKNLGVPAWAINQALQESSIVKAIHTLASEGVLPSPIARRLLQSANKITEEVKSSFDISPEAEYLPEKKVVALIKQAILGANE